MTALLFGALTALVWAAGAMTASRSSRRIGAVPTLTWVMLVGVVIAVPLAVAGGTPRHGVAAGPLAWLAVAGLTNVLGLGCVYAAFARGRVGVVAALVSTEGALAAVISVAAGERPGAWILAGLALAAGGVALVASATGDAEPTPARHGRTAVLLALAAASLFAVTLFSAGKASGDVPASWVALPARLVALVLIAAAVPFGVRPGRPGRRMAWAAVTGVIEVAGLSLFALGARDSIAITSVVASQFSALAAIAAFLIDRERLTRRQVLGIGAIAVGVAVVAAVG